MRVCDTLWLHFMFSHTCARTLTVCTLWGRMKNGPRCSVMFYPKRQSHQRTITTTTTHIMQAGMIRGGVVWKISTIGAGWCSSVGNLSRAFCGAAYPTHMISFVRMTFVFACIMHITELFNKDAVDDVAQFTQTHTHTWADAHCRWCALI